MGPNKIQHLLISANVCSHLALFRLPLVKMLLRAGYRITVLAAEDEYSEIINEFREVNYIPLKKLSRGSINPISHLQFLMELYSIYKKIQPDFIIHFTIKPNIWGGLAAAQLKIPHLCVISGLGTPFIRGGWLKKMVGFLYKISLKRAQAVITENREDAALLVERGLVNRLKIRMLEGCGVDIRKFHPELREKSESKKTVFTFIGRLIYDKGIKEYAAAAKQALTQDKSLHFNLVGQPDPNSLSNISDGDLWSWSKWLIVHGQKKDVIPILTKTDCLVLPSYREAISKVVQEAMAMGIPVITTDAPGGRESVVDGLNGYLVKPGCVEDLLDKIVLFAALSAEEKEKMGQYGRDIAEKKFDERRNLRCWQKILKESGFEFTNCSSETVEVSDVSKLKIA